MFDILIMVESDQSPLKVSPHTGAKCLSKVPRMTVKSVPIGDIEVFSSYNFSSLDDPYNGICQGKGDIFQGNVREIHLPDLADTLFQLNSFECQA